MIKAVKGLSMIAVLPHGFAVSAFVGPLAATAEQAGDLMVILRDRGFLDRFPSFGIRCEYRVRKTSRGYVEVKDQPKDYYLVGATSRVMQTRARRELGTSIRRATGQAVCFSNIPFSLASAVMV